MKKLALIVLLVVGLATYAQVEQKQERKRAEMSKMTTEERSEFRLERITKLLDLTEKQKKEIAPILAEQLQQREKLLADHKARKEKGSRPTAEEREIRAQQREENQKVMRGKLQKILSAEQLAKWDEMVERNKERSMEKKRNLSKQE